MLIISFPCYKCRKYGWNVEVFILREVGRHFLLFKNKCYFWFSSERAKKLKKWFVFCFFETPPPTFSFLTNKWSLWALGGPWWPGLKLLFDLEGTLKLGGKENYCCTNQTLFNRYSLSTHYVLAPELVAEFLEANETHNYGFNLSMKFFPHDRCCKLGLSCTPAAYLKLGKMAGGVQEV